MANVQRINGFKPVKHFNGSAYTGQANIYECPAAEAAPVFVGDFVVMSTNASTSGYITVATACGTNTQVTTAVIVGAVVGIFNTKLDVDGKMTAGSIALDTPYFRAASTKQFLLVCDATDIIYECDVDAVVTQAQIGLNVSIGSADITVTANSTGQSAQYAYATTTPTASTTRPLQILGFVKRVDNDNTLVNGRILVRVSTHAYGNAVAGV